MFDIRAVAREDRGMVNCFLTEQWFSTEMILRGKRVDLSDSPGWIAWEDKEIIGLVTVRMSEEDCEILSLDSLLENRGIGTALVNRVVEAAQTAGVKKVKLITTNDNIRAIRFYQKRGFDMAHLYRNAMDISRKLKPAIPMTGMEGIPLRHEIEFELLL